jgi:heme exporter protein D
MRAGGWLYWVAVGLSGLTLALVVAYIVLVQDNRTVQTEVNQRQQFINQSIQLSRGQRGVDPRAGDGRG